MPNNNQHITYSISPKSVIQTLLIILAFVFAWLIRDIVATFFIALILAAGFDPIVDYLHRKKIPRALGLISIYVVFLGVLSFIIIKLSGTIAGELRDLTLSLPHYYDALNDFIGQFQSASGPFADSRLQTVRGGISDMIQNLSGLATSNVLSVLRTFFGSIVSVVLVFVITFYLVVQQNAVRKFLIWLVPKSQEEFAMDIMEKIQVKMGLWFRGQLILSLVIFVVTYVGLKILGVEYALVLALFAGMAEVIPYLGPVISAVPALFLTLTSPTGGWFKTLLVLILYIIVQQLENNFVVPKVMSKTVGLNPLIVILSILIGAKVAGVAGAIMAVPLATAVTVYLQERWHKGEEPGLQ